MIVDAYFGACSANDSPSMREPTEVQLATSNTHVVATTVGAHAASGRSLPSATTVPPIGQSESSLRERRRQIPAPLTSDVHVLKLVRSRNAYFECEYLELARPKLCEASLP